MSDYILVPLVLLAIVAVAVAILWVVLGRAARGMVSALGEYNEAQADLRAARRETVTGGYLTFPRNTSVAQRHEAVRRFNGLNAETPPSDPKV